MSFLGRSLLQTEDLSDKDIDRLFFLTSLFKSDYQKNGFLSCLNTGDRPAQIMGLLFFEPSTRTRASFQVAASRLGVQNFLLSSVTDTSLSKGETWEETFENVAAMDPDVLVVRSQESPELQVCFNNSKVPVINGGCGSIGHPTQAILDAFTILSRRGKIEGERVLLVGDVMHSRVAHSNLKLLQRLGATVALCGPDTMLPRDEGMWKGLERFEKLKEGMAWCTVCMGLRVQKERHLDDTQSLSLSDYRSRFCVEQKVIESLDPKAIIMHPGPFVKDVDFSIEVLKDPRCVVREQVRNGVYSRAALLSMILGWEPNGAN